MPKSPPVPSRGFLIAMLTGLAFAALCDLFSIFAGVRYWLMIDGDAGFVTASQRELDAAASLYETAARYQVMVFLPCAIVFVVWFFRMRRATGPLAPDRFRNGPGWAVGAWFVPLANLWMPYRVAFDMWGAATPLPCDGEGHRPRIWPLNLWWGLFVFSVLSDRFARTKYEDAGTLTEIRDGLVRYVVSDALHILAAAAAAYFAVRLTTMQRHKAVHGPFGTAAVEHTPAGSA
ncbi:DUF4328 domain-containing protein [Streptomyces kebangsaanensis]|uniref:DUF4328 domain-containing protein n=1 Tax=Streptomyces kebangsaanensis TaxID=864058 RepID=UPI001F32A34F|nr:DUF4328 domain-containing protein [Streptomyces kebangsaanensis]